jgi:DNA polymerase-3 subunit delta'
MSEHDWDFHGNRYVVASLERMIEENRLAQTIMLHGPSGIGKATLARRIATRLLDDRARIEQDDLSRETNLQLVADREKWTAEKRNEDPLLFASHPDFVTFAPDGPLRQISIPQMRLLKERAQYQPLKGRRRVFLIDRIDRANEQAANSLLKTLEEPPAHMIFVITTENAYDLLPTIRSRSMMFAMTPLSTTDMAEFLKTRPKLDHLDRRLALASGSPGTALSLDLEVFDKRRAAMLALLKVASRQAPFSSWLKLSESISASKSEKLEYYLEVLYGLLRDILQLQHGGSNLQNPDLRKDLEAMATAVSFRWISVAVKEVDQMSEYIRRNIQKGIALDAFAVRLQAL